MGTDNLTRRGLIGLASAAAASGAAIVAGVATATSVTLGGLALSPFAAAHGRYIAATTRLNGYNQVDVRDPVYDRLEADYLDALRTVDTMPAETWSEFVLALEVAWADDGDPHEDLKLKLLNDVRRLAGKPEKETL